MEVGRLKIANFRGIKSADLIFNKDTLLIGANNIGKSTVCEALDLVLGPDRLNRFPVVEEYDFYNAEYLDDEENPISIEIEVLLSDLSTTIENACFTHLERWNPTTKEILNEGKIDDVDSDGFEWCLRILTIARYNPELDEFEAFTHYRKDYSQEDEQQSRFPRTIKRKIGFIYLRALRTGSRALSLERGSLLDSILRIDGFKPKIWEEIRQRLENLSPPIDEGATSLSPILKAIEARVAEFVSLSNPGKSTRLFTSKLTREHLRKTLSFFISVTEDQKPVPFQEVGTGTLNILVLALLSFIADLKVENVIFAMEEPEIALAPHTQRRIADFLRSKTSQSIITSHSPYIIEKFDPENIMILRRNNSGEVEGVKIELADIIKLKTYKKYIRRGFSEAMLGKGVIVTEGITEVYTLQAVSEIMENEDQTFYPLDLSGVTIITTDGDGSVAEFGKFFSSLGLPTYGFMDTKTRSEKEKESLAEAGFKSLLEIPYYGMEELMVNELNQDILWKFLDSNRDVFTPNFDIPEERPEIDEIKKLTSKILKKGKGWGRSADLVSLCQIDELPGTITSFLENVYSDFKKPETFEILEEENHNGIPTHSSTIKEFDSD